MVKKPGAPAPSPTEYFQDSKALDASLFEQFLLFDKLSFKVYGENIPLAVLMHHFGAKGIEKLIEQDALHFVLWNSLVTFFVDEIEGVDPLQSGVLSSAAHSDPEESIMLGFNWMANPPKRSIRRNLMRKLRDKYSLPDKELPAKTVAITKSAYDSGKLKVYGLNPEETAYNQVSSSKRKRLCECATEMLEYSHLVTNGMSSYGKYEFCSIFNASGKKIEAIENIDFNFNELIKIENMPNLKELYFEVEDPYKKMLDVRSKDSSEKFRKWLAEVSSSEENIEITKEYIDAIANARGFFETKKGKFVKAISMSSIGAGVGALIAGPGGALFGASAAKVLEPIADVSLDLIDEFLLSGLTKGWTPKMFFSDIEKLNSNAINRVRLD